MCYSTIFSFLVNTLQLYFLFEHVAKCHVAAICQILYSRELLKHIILGAQNFIAVESKRVDKNLLGVYKFFIFFL